MPSTKRQTATAKILRETNMMSELDNLDIMLGDENINQIGRELGNTIRESTVQYDTESISHLS